MQMGHQRSTTAGAQNTSYRFAGTAGLEAGGASTRPAKCSVQLGHLNSGASENGFGRKRKR